MTPKEKAKELYWKFYNYTDCEFYQFQHQYAKECALIAVDEILNVIYRDMNYQNVYAFFLDVKQELDKL